MYVVLNGTALCIIRLEYLRCSGRQRKDCGRSCSKKTVASISTG